MVDLSKGCSKCGCYQYEKVYLHYIRPKNLILTVCTLGFWMVWITIKSSFGGYPYRCVSCKTYLPW